MVKRSKVVKIFSLITLFAFISTTVPNPAFGKVQPITEMEQKLEGISEEEKAVLEELFTIRQQIDEMQKEEARISSEIDALQVQSKNTEKRIEDKQKNYDQQLEILKQILVSYQRGGPASNLEILLSADNLTMFLKSINIIKDISHNVGELLDSVEKDKKVLEDEKANLAEQLKLTEQKKIELQEPLLKEQQLKIKQEEYLASLQEQSVYYQEQLDQIEQMWSDSKLLFSDIVSEVTKIVGEGYFTLNDLNLFFDFIKMEGAIYEDTFNGILKEHSKLPETIFRFNADQIQIEVPEKHLVLTGNFVITGDSAVQFEVESGTFYDMPLEAASITELFINGPILIDFKKLAEVTIDFKLINVESQDGMLSFEIKPQF